ncbi:MAG: hypothetical protein KDA69_05850 [Planctomycetaceae bacterium]|nr:hypothetical protein [Planctomycetaceae bacterium]
MNLLLLTYILFLTFSVLITVVVGKILHRLGRPFLIECLAGREAVADATNDLLLVGYYLLNIAMATYFVVSRLHPATTVEVFGILTHKIGLVLLVLGGMHFVNVGTALTVRSVIHRKPLVSGDR